MVDDVDLALTDADRLQEHFLLPGGVHEEKSLQRCLRQATERATARHRADVYALIEKMVRKADAVTEQRAFREGARRIDGQHPDLAVPLARVLDERRQQRAL